MKHVLMTLVICGLAAVSVEAQASHRSCRTRCRGGCLTAPPARVVQRRYNDGYYNNGYRAYSPRVRVQIGSGYYGGGYGRGYGHGYYGGGYGHGYYGGHHYGGYGGGHYGGHHGGGHIDVGGFHFGF